MTSSRTREIVCGFLRFNFQGKTMDNEPDDIDEDDYEEDENDLGDLLTNDDWEDTKVYAEIRAAMPSGWIMTKVTNFNSQKLSGKPCVDFIRVGNLESYDNDNDKWQRKNIGLALYVYGARWCRETLGLDLRGSGLQSDKAKAAWDKMQQLGWVEPDKTDPKRRIINPDLVK
jgi:hypothetical protein